MSPFLALLLSPLEAAETTFVFLYREFSQKKLSITDRW